MGFLYSAATEGTLQTILTPDRLSSYPHAKRGDLSQAIQLYVWNTAECGAQSASGV
jgi:hypothetical protein